MYLCELEKIFLHQIFTINVFTMKKKLRGSRGIRSITIPKCELHGIRVS